MIQAEHLSRRFGDRQAVEDVTFHVERGEIFGLLGPNGAGKTTTLRMLAGLIPPTSGTATVAGYPLTKGTIGKVRSSVGLLTEAPGLWDRLTVRRNLLTYAGLYELPDPQRAVAEVLERFGLTDRAEDLAAELSKGLKQRVALARTLLHRPPVLLLDEPTSGLDPQSARHVRDLVRELKSEGHSIVISTHNLDEAERVADRVGVLRRRFLAVAAPSALRQQLFGTRVQVELDGPADAFAPAVEAAGGHEIKIADRVLSFAADEPRAVVPEVVRQLVLAGARVLRVAPIEAPLEDIYLALIDDGRGEDARPDEGDR